MVTTTDLYLGRYRIETEIASGGMGTVYSARDERLNRPVALKVLSANLLAEADLVERFRREARAVAALSHPNIAGVFDYGEQDGRPVIAMELAPGKDLGQILRSEGPLDIERAVRIGSQICAALAHAHAAGIVHRDIKPANVIVSETDDVKVTDFGIARATGDEKLTATGSVMGTAHYISPEQAGGGATTASSDIYSAGIVLYEMLTGVVPYTGDSLMSVALRHINETVPAPSGVRREVPAALDEVVARATAKDPRRRFRDAAEMAGALADEAHGATQEGTGGTTAVLPVAAARTTALSEQTVWPIPGTRWDPQRVGKWALIVLGALAAIAAVLLLLRLDDIRPSTRAAQKDRAAPREEVAPPSFTMPAAERLVGGNPGAVADVLERYGFDVSFAFANESEFGVDVAEGEIVWSDPEPGSIVNEGDTITLYLNPPSGTEPRGKGKAKGKDKEND